MQNVPEKVADVMTKKHVFTCKTDTSIDEGTAYVHMPCRDCTSHIESMVVQSTIIESAWCHNLSDSLL